MNDDEPSVEIVRAESVPRTPALNDEGLYKGYRYRIVELFERYTHDKASALELMERYERGVMGAMHLVAPSANSMRLGFQAAAQKFLEDPNG